MKVENQKVVSVTYQLYIKSDKDEEVLVEQMKEEAPLTWCQGEGMMLPAFEAQMAGKEVGDIFDFVLKKEEAYGEYDKNGVMKLDKTIFYNGDNEFDSERVYEGAIVPMRTEDGQVLKALVFEITDDKVTLDFNHPYAGEDLHFTGKVLDIREATEAELDAIRNPHKCGGCSGKCGDCESDCGNCEGGCCEKE